MPINYNESQVEGVQWTRCYSVTCDNPINTGNGSAKQVTFLEETVINLSNTILKLDELRNSITIAYDSNGSFPLLDPATGNPTGSNGTHDQLYQMLFSLYRYSAEQRDLENP